MRAPSLAVALTSVALLASCGAPQSSTTSLGRSPSVEVMSSPGESPDRSIPEVLDFQAATVEGGRVTGADLVGKDVVFWFWAPW